MTLKPDLIKGQVRVSPLYNLDINLSFVYLKIHKKNSFFYLFIFSCVDMNIASVGKVLKNMILM